MGSKFAISIIFAIIAVTARVGFYVLTPPLLDLFKNNETSTNQSVITNVSTIGPPQQSRHGISIFFLLSGQWLICVVITFLWLSFILIFNRIRLLHSLKFKLLPIILSGFSQGISSILINYAASGSRTPPYLQAILGNFNIPIQFTIRFLMLRKRPTMRKISCAIVVLLMELVCLIPTIFPNLQTKEEKKDNGGASSTAGRILWPICFVMSQIPFAICNSMMEKTLKSTTMDFDKKKINIIYFIFWFSLSCYITILMFFWLDFMPDFGSCSSIVELGEKLRYNFQCIVGIGNGCGIEIALLAWGNFICNFFGIASFVVLLRYSEGANFVMILLCLRTPIAFLFWTLFEEPPLRWKPHLNLSTWLSIGAIIIMLPAIIVYNTGPPEIIKNKSDTQSEPLINDKNDNNTSSNGFDDIIEDRK